MRRSARGEQSAFSLFPFLAVLLCTMGALVVLLVAMAHVSRDKAREEAELAAAAAEAARLAVDSPERRELEAKLVEAQDAAQKWREVNLEGKKRLEQEQLRLSDIEDHLRRLRSEAEELITESHELFAVEEEHYDDEKIAKIELERLQRLIDQKKDDLAELKQAAGGRVRKYAIEALRDSRTGTSRPPAYFECTENGVVIQPDGIELTWEDLVMPKHSGPVGAASRAIARYYEEHPEARGANESGDPYPLLIVRPNGVTAYYLARDALESSGADFGFQPVSDEWEIEYGAANPVLAQQIEEAVSTARLDRQGLAQMIPELNAAMASAERDAQLELAYSGDGEGDAPTGVAGIRVRPADPDANNPFEGLRIEGALPGENNPLSKNNRNREQGRGGGEGEGGDFDGPAGVATTEPGEAAEQADGSLGTRYGLNTNGSLDGGQQASPSANSLAASSLESSGADAAGEKSRDMSVTVGLPGDKDGSVSNGASKRNTPTRDGVPMVRPIRLYVTRDRVALVPDKAHTASEALVAAANPEGVDFPGATTDRINDLIEVLKNHAESWGIAGDGLYWDPRMMLRVGPGGAQRADEIRQLLEAAGLNVQTSPVATASTPSENGGARATR